jgi:hypothetical protein
MGALVSVAPKLGKLVRLLGSDRPGEVQAISAKASITELEKCREALADRRRSALLDEPDALPGIEKEIAATELELGRLRDGLIALQTRHEQAVKEEFGKYLEQRAEQARADAATLLEGYRQVIELLKKLGEITCHLSDVRSRMDAINSAVAQAKRSDLRVRDPWTEIGHAAPSDWRNLPITAFVAVPSVFPFDLHAGRRRENLVLYDRLLEAIDAVTPAPKTKRQAKRA